MPVIMSRLFEISYWFNFVPGTPNLLFWRFIDGAAVIIIIIAVVALVIGKKFRKDRLRKKFWNQLATWGFVAGPIFLLLSFFRFQNAYLLSMRALVFSWIIASVLWLAFILKYKFFVMPKKLEARDQEQAFKQYLPQKK